MTGERLVDHFRTHPIVPEPAALTEALATLRDATVRVRKLEVDQLGARQGRNGNVEWRKDSLRRGYMMPLKRLAARQLKQLVPAEVFSVPHKRERANAVADAALRMIDALGPHPALLANAGLPPDFLEHMRREAYDLKLVERRSASARNQLSIATRDIVVELERIAAAVVVIDGLAMAHGRSDTWRSYWRGLGRVPKRRGRPPKRRKGRNGPADPSKDPRADHKRG